MEKAASQDNFFFIFPFLLLLQLPEYFLPSQAADIIVIVFTPSYTILITVAQFWPRLKWSVNASHTKLLFWLWSGRGRCHWLVVPLPICQNCNAFACKSAQKDQTWAFSCHFMTFAALGLSDIVLFSQEWYGDKMSAHIWIKRKFWIIFLQKIMYYLSRVTLESDKVGKCVSNIVEQANCCRFNLFIPN